MIISERVVLKFPKELVDKPTISALVRKYDIEFNILQAQVLPQKEGLMVVVFTGEEKIVKQALNDLKNQNVGLQRLKQDITKDDKICTHCGVCIGLCPTNAFYYDQSTKKVIFDYEKCITCMLCVKGCMVRAIKIKF
ncbi:MAG TPA: NIL domain-containing protein [bacterium]|nr:NIL domain-containing protein [bacterium]HPO52631.1 NIL domain-containing protein [bacterium]HXK45188.1 NIL domain-containing protein [bacterium]